MVVVVTSGLADPCPESMSTRAKDISGTRPSLTASWFRFENALEKIRMTTLQSSMSEIPTCCMQAMEAILRGS